MKNPAKLRFQSVRGTFPKTARLLLYRGLHAAKAELSSCDRDFHRLPKPQIFIVWVLQRNLLIPTLKKAEKIRAPRKLGSPEPLK